MAGVAKVVVGARDPTQDGVERLRSLGIEVDVEDLWEARKQNESWLAWTKLRRPFVTYKVAQTLDGRVTVPEARWISCAGGRRLVPELRARSDAVAVGMGTVRADDPQLDARDVEVVRQPRRLAFGLGPLPEGSPLELRQRDPAVELPALAEEGVQSILLEGGPTLATAFLERDLIDKLLFFTAPRLSGSGPHVFRDLAKPVDVTRVSVRAVGSDLLVEAYIHEP